mgnify:CR=1 FL=1
MTAPDGPRIDLRRRAQVKGIAWGALATSAGIGGVASTALLFPRVHPRPDVEFEAGHPADYLIGELSERYLRAHRVLIGRTEAGIYVLSAECTHLGCIVRWQARLDRIQCFCHGSAFDERGRERSGPAPRALERVRVRRSVVGTLLIDPSVRYREERGEWDSEGAILPFSEGRRG